MDNQIMVEKNKKIRLGAASYNENIKIIWTDAELNSGFVPNKPDIPYIPDLHIFANMEFN